MLDEGYIKIHRKITKWEWYDDDNVFKVFLHLLLTVNWEDGKWHGIEIKRGQRITSTEKLAKETNLSVKQIRTVLRKLQETRRIDNQIDKQIHRYNR